MPGDRGRRILNALPAHRMPEGKEHMTIRRLCGSPQQPFRLKQALWTLVATYVAMHEKVADPVSGLFLVNRKFHFMFLAN